MLPLREPLDVQLYWAMCVSLFAFLLYAIALQSLIEASDVRAFRFARSEIVRGAAGALTIVVVATVASREVELAPDRMLAIEMTTLISRTQAAQTDKEIALVALGGVATPAAASAEQATFGVAAKRIDEGQPTLLDAYWYWGSQRSLRERTDIRSALVISPRPAPDELPSNWTEVAHVAAPTTPPSHLPERVATAVVTSGAPIELTPAAPDILPTVVDGLLPGACEEATGWIEDPSRFPEEAPAALVELYRAGLVASPALPSELREELWVDPFDGLWAYRVEGVVARDLAQNKRIVLNRLGCER